MLDQSLLPCNPSSWQGDCLLGTTSSQSCLTRWGNLTYSYGVLMSVHCLLIWVDGHKVGCCNQYQVSISAVLERFSKLELLFISILINRTFIHKTMEIMILIIIQLDNRQHWLTDCQSGVSSPTFTSFFFFFTLRIFCLRIILWEYICENMFLREYIAENIFWEYVC